MTAGPADIHHPAGPRTPEIDFRFSQGVLRLEGESYPEDVTKLFGPVIAAVDAWLATAPGAARLEVALFYFNSSSAKAIMMLFERLDEAARHGTAVEVVWRFDAEDDSMEELGEEFGEDLEHATFRLEPVGEEP
ncbi:DUF1987 domain-containing protein [Palleronia abyssalis]|uniref:SiaC family regulatory phosphoprotein domain-containing protein n=1 Tax=Palleronia abyssalis TaxID=1501240 RepID=A0A2R8BZ91_9RHOB|nr:DUF1987 domain-containing protein [Palleronia abyssalis]SPJ25459.1 hypothetical protein PAA8504_03310 [Palleronia abyssalis]